MYRTADARAFDMRSLNLWFLIWFFSKYSQAQPPATNQVLRAAAAPYQLLVARHPVPSQFPFPPLPWRWRKRGSVRTYIADVDESSDQVWFLTIIQKSVDIEFSSRDGAINTFPIASSPNHAKTVMNNPIIPATSRVPTSPKCTAAAPLWPIPPVPPPEQSPFVPFSALCRIRASILFNSRSHKHVRRIHNNTPCRIRRKQQPLYFTRVRRAHCRHRYPRLDELRANRLLRSVEAAIPIRERELINVSRH